MGAKFYYLFLKKQHTLHLQDGPYQVSIYSLNFTAYKLNHGKVKTLEKVSNDSFLLLLICQLGT